MTKLKIGLISAIVAVSVAVPLYFHHQSQSRLREENEALQRAVQENLQLTAENDRLARLATPPHGSQSATNEQFRELMKLRGEVGQLRRQVAADPQPAAASTNRQSALDSFAANPEMKKVIRDQQKAGLSMIYKDFAKRLKLAPEQGEKLNDLLADNVMENIDHVTSVLREKKSVEEMTKVFGDQEAASSEKVRALLGPDAAAQYEEYTHNLLSHLTAEQFKEVLKANKTPKEQSEEQSQRLYALLQEETKAALENAGLPPNFQPVPTLNFINFASEQETEKNLKLVEDIYSRVSARANSFLSPEDLKKFTDFQSTVINGNRMSLGINRKLMTP